MLNKICGKRKGGGRKKRSYKGKIKIRNSEFSRIHFYGDTSGEKGNGSLRSPKYPILRSDASFPLVGERSEHIREKRNKIERLLLRYERFNLMSPSMITLGALKKKTREYVSPKLANKENEHVCIECNRDLVLCRGEIRVCHFRHRTETIKCCYYNGPNETQIHKDAKLLLKMLLDRKIPLSFIRKCTCCGKDEEFDIPEITECSSIEIEYRFDYNGLKIADVAYISWYMRLVYDYTHTSFTEEDAEIAENGTIAIYYVDINWILSQTDTPTRIHYIAGVDCYSKDSIFIDCRKCNAHFAFYVKRMNFHTENYKVINMGCFDCGHNSNTEFANCFRCKENTTPLCVMETNIHPLICKQCDIDLYGKTLLQVPFEEKEDIKDLGGRFDYLCKKWYVDDDNDVMDIILSHWKKAILGIINTKNP